MNYKIITAVYNAGAFFDRYVKSIEAQTYPNMEVVIVDDASTDGTTEKVVAACEKNMWNYVRNEVNRGALFSQVSGIRFLDQEPAYELREGEGHLDPDDVLVFVDGDDQLAPGALEKLDDYYQFGAKLTYGQYESVPFSPTCQLAAPFPQKIIEERSFRKVSAMKGGIYWNHLRTFKYELFAQLTDDDFKDAEGGWYKTATDAALMYPALELASPSIEFIPEVLYYYTSDNGISDWRRWPKQCDRDHQHILAREPKR